MDTGSIAMNRLDNDLQKAILEKTNPAINDMDVIWNNIQNNLEEKTMKKNANRNIIGIVAACLILVLIVGGLFTPTGRAAVGKIIDLFEDEKQIVTEVEGETETADQQLQIGTTPSPAPSETQQTQLMTYIMYVDESNYSFESSNGIDIIKPLDFPDTLPEVYMEISQVLNLSKEDVADSLIQELNGEYETVYEPYSVTEPIDGICIDAHDGDLNGTKETMPQWDSKVVKYYLVDNTQGGTFVIKMKYFIEAQEGHGARFDAMLNEFTIVPAE